MTTYVFVLFFKGQLLSKTLVMENEEDLQLMCIYSVTKTLISLHGIQIHA